MTRQHSLRIQNRLLRFAEHACTIEHHDAGLFDFFILEWFAIGQDVMLRYQIEAVYDALFPENYGGTA